jgi:hypothetical protein
MTKKNDKKMTKMRCVGKFFPMDLGDGRKKKVYFLYRKKHKQ